MIGNLEQVYVNNTKTGKQYFTVLIDGRKYSYWGELHGAQVGDRVEYETKQNGQYTNVSTLKKVGEVTGSPAEAAPQQGGAPAGPSSRDIFMLTSYAKDLVVAGKTKEEAVEIVRFLLSEFSKS